MSGLSNTYENLVLEHLVGRNDMTPLDVYVALFTVAPTDSSAGTEVSGGGYTRLSASAMFGDASNGVIASQADFEWPTATADWGTVTSAALMDAPTGGNVIAFGTAASPKEIAEGDVYRIPSGSFQITLD